MAPTPSCKRSMANALAGHRVVVTRAAEQADELMQHLAAAGATPIALPTIAIVPPADPAPLAAARCHAAGYDGFIFTSANAVAAYLASPAPARPAASWVCAVGPATAAALARLPAWAPDRIPDASSAAGVLAALAHAPLAGQAILFPRSAIAPGTIPAALAARGALVTAVDAYQTIVATASQAPARTLFPAGAPVHAATAADTVVFTSASTARNLAALLGDDYRARLRHVALAALGPSTRAAMEQLGLDCAVQAPATTAASLVAALAEYWHARTTGS